MSAATDIQTKIGTLLGAHAGFPTGIKIITRTPGDIANDIDAAVAKLGICLWVMPLRALKVTANAPFVFVEDGELRVRIFESPVLNRLKKTAEAAAVFDAYAAMDEVMLAINGVNPDSALPDAIYLRENPTEIAEDGETGDRVFDVLFTAVYQLNPEEPEEP